jgi:hypothetical protein
MPRARRGLLSCFFAAARGELWASSSPALLASIVGGDPAAPTPRLERAQRIDWFPLPQSGIPGVRRLLPSQTLPLDGRAEPEPRRLPAAARARPYAELLESLEAQLVGALRNVAGLHDTLYLPLTGGFDSRLLLAAAVKSGVEVSTYTYVKPDPLMAYADRTLPPVLAGAAGVSHRFIDRGPLSHDRLEAFDAHTARHCVEVDRDYLAYGQWDQLGPPGVVLRGGVFEIGRCYYWRKLHARGDRGAAVAEAFHPDPQQAAAIAEWVRWCERHPEPGLDWRDRFYLEQRLAGWLGSLEQALDLTAHERIHLANCHDFISTLLELPVEVRLASRHHVDLIRRMAPALLDVPFDARMPVRERAGRELKALGAATDKRAHVGFRLRRLGRRLVRFATAG